jgi:hypothetical protein
MPALLLAAAPAAHADTVNVTLTCNSGVSFNADIGDTVLFTFAAPCNTAPSTDGLQNNRVLGTATDPGFLSNNDGAGETETTSWWRYAAAGAVSTTLMGTTTGHTLDPGDVVAAVFINDSAGDYQITWLGNRIRPAAAAALVEAPPRNLSVQHLSYARAAGETDCQPGYSPSWAQWPNGGTGGFTCDRSVYKYYPDEPVM